MRSSRLSLMRSSGSLTAVSSSVAILFSLRLWPKEGFCDNCDFDSNNLGFVLKIVSIVDVRNYCYLSTK